MAKKKSMTQLAKEIAEDHIELGSTPLTHDETLRGSALSLACRYYVETIVKDGDMYREMVRDNRVLKPATYMGVLEVALAFEAFIRGELKETLESISVEVDKLTESDRSAQKEAADVR